MNFSNFGQVLLVFSCLVFSILADTTTVSGYICQNGKSSIIQCKSGFLGRKSCDNSILICEGGKYCCEPTSSTKRGVTKPYSSTTSSSFSINSSTISSSSSSSSSNSSCSKCSTTIRNDCFRSLHILENLTIPTTSCQICEGCCGDAFPDKCKIWKNKQFCDMEWYSRDKKLILCGKTCGFC
ncbi:unnamed protein product [Caenorhabditis angaria]|uniref:ShKT domain-containing protein n=1 Tax=Caenorhabditis angaria TaxID=860376 RepID=A0A9P1N5M0_9PELO|nr:unnamed protein product [Caenorhabditis angaria]